DLARRGQTSAGRVRPSGSDRAPASAHALFSRGVRSALPRSQVTAPAVSTLDPARHPPPLPIETTLRWSKTALTVDAAAAIADIIQNYDIWMIVATLCRNVGSSFWRSHLDACTQGGKSCQRRRRRPRRS